MLGIKGFGPSQQSQGGRGGTQWREGILLQEAGAVESESKLKASDCKGSEKTEVGDPRSRGRQIQLLFYSDAMEKNVVDCQCGSGEQTSPEWKRKRGTRQLAVIRPAHLKPPMVKNSVILSRSRI